MIAALEQELTAKWTVQSFIGHPLWVLMKGILWKQDHNFELINNIGEWTHQRYQNTGEEMQIAHHFLHIREKIRFSIEKNLPHVLNTQSRKTETFRLRGGGANCDGSLVKRCLHTFDYNLFQTPRGPFYLNSKQFTKKFPYTSV